MNKRGDLTGVFFLIVNVAIFAIFILIVGFIAPEISNELVKNIGISEGINDSLNATTNVAQNTLSTLWLIVFGGLLLGLFATSFFIETHPIFVPIYGLLLVVAVLVAVPLSNAYEQLAADAHLAATSTTQTMVNFFMSYLPLMTLIIGLLALVITFAKPGPGGATLA